MTLIPAVGYLRKSTKGQDSSGKERQEKSISQQKSEIIAMAKGKYKVESWYSDEGISGSNRGIARPDFQRMLDEAKEHGAQAILVDNIDRFSRAAFGDVQEDANTLRKAGVRYIVTVSHGSYDLGARYEIGDILKFVVSVWSACEYSRQLSRRITLARRNKAAEGLRSGGSAPYAMKNDGKGGLIAGDSKHVKTVQRIFDLYANQAKSMNGIANLLNIEGVPGPKGGKWLTSTVRELLQRRVYRGDFQFNLQRGGKFFQVDDKRDVVEVGEKKEKGHHKYDDAGVFNVESAYKPMVSPALYDKAQKRIAIRAAGYGPRHADTYALSGFLRCGHCGGPLHGCKPNHKYTIYKCGTQSRKGASQCKQRQVREDKLLPFLLAELGKDITKLLDSTPDHLMNPRNSQIEKREEAKKDRERLAKQIARAEENLLLVEDDRTRQSLDKRVASMRDELEALDNELAAAIDGGSAAKAKEERMRALREWWESFDARAISVAIPAGLNMRTTGGLNQDPMSDESAILVDPAKLHAAFVEIGLEVKIWWKTTAWTTKAGDPRHTYTLERGRYRLAQKTGNLPKYLLEGTGHRTPQKILATLARVDRVFSGSDLTRVPPVVESKLTA